MHRPQQSARRRAVGLRRAQRDDRTALADDADWNQKSLTAGQLAKVYGFTDLDGSRRDVWAFMALQEAGEQPAHADFR